jgi:predicted XRE-type DNA-binding protein
VRGTKRIAVERGSGNVYADIGRPDAELQLLKAGLVSQIEATIRQRRLTQAQAAVLLDLSQPDVSRLLRGDFREYSIERLLRLLMILGRDIAILVRTTKAQRRGRLSIEAA